MNAPSKECIVIGGRGFVGTAIAEEAVRRHYRVTVVEKDDYDKHIGKSADLLINANGNSKKFLAAQDPKLEFDLSVRSVLRSLHDFKTAKYVHLSTIDVYPNHEYPQDNAERVNIDITKLSPYGLHKHLAEHIVRYYAPSWLIFRMAGFVGPRLWKNSIYDLLKNRPLRVHPDSEYQYLHTRDLARILFDVTEKGADKEIFNLTGDGVINLRTIASWIPECQLSPDLAYLARERYEVCIDKIKQLATIPQTQDTVKKFVDDVLAGEVEIL